MAAALATCSTLQLQRNPLGSRAAPRQMAAAPARRRLTVQAAIKPPQGVTQPPVQPVVSPSTFGFVDNAERLNSRAAMLGFFALLLLELVAGKGILDLIGLTTGNGLGFEF